MQTPFQRARTETEARATREKRVEVIEGNFARAGLGMPGSLTLMVAYKDSGLVPKIRKALKEGRDAKPIVADALKARRSRTRERAFDFDLMAAQPVFADVRHGAFVIGSGFHVPPGNVLSLGVFPYNGGTLFAEGITLVEYCREGVENQLEAVALLTPPALTAAEKAAVRAVPASQRSSTIGTHMECKTTYWGLAAIALATATITCFLRTHPTGTSVDSSELKRLGPTASARKLLALRRQILTRAFAKSHE